MSNINKNILIAISGGIDSSVAAALLREDGHNCTGVFMITCDAGKHTQKQAQAVADKLNIQLHTLDLRKDFEQIIDYFCNEYQKGRTPNPCILCNRIIKFGLLWRFAQKIGCQYIATGHYASILEHENKKYLYQAADIQKDQSYVLSMIQKDMLERIILPMGRYLKAQTRRIAAGLNLNIQTQTESQEICFIPDNNYATVLEQIRPELARPGNIIDSSGNILGTHNGIHNFTIGQRRGLKVAMGIPWYVCKIDAQTNTVTLGPKEQIMHSKLLATDINFLAEIPTAPFKALVKVRYNDRGSPATVIPDKNTVSVIFDKPKLAVTPGQLAVFYTQFDQTYRVIGAGWIEKAEI
jgi:tRNA-specific 2-thiouridylase